MAGVEVGLVLGLMNLSTGSIWAYPTWNTWWTWDPRLTSDAIMCLTYVAYLMLRQGIENVETRRRFAAVYGILAYSTAIITLIITRIRPDTIHPVVIGNSPQNAQGGFALTPSMIVALSVNSIVWSILVPWVLVWWRIRLENQSQRVQAQTRSVDGAVGDVSFRLSSRRAMFPIRLPIYFLAWWFSSGCCCCSLARSGSARAICAKTKRDRAVERGRVNFKCLRSGQVFDLLRFSLFPASNFAHDTWMQPKQPRKGGRQHFQLEEGRHFTKGNTFVAEAGIVRFHVA